MVCVCVCLSVCLSIRPCIAFLFEGTAEIALQNLTDLSAYTERKRRWQSGVRFSVEQVTFLALKLHVHVAVKINYLQSLRFSCPTCKHRPRNYWPPIQVCCIQGSQSLKCEGISVHFCQERVDHPVVAMESLYLENAVCVFTRKSCEEAALGIGLSFTKDLRYMYAVLSTL